MSRKKQSNLPAYQGWAGPADTEPVARMFHELELNHRCLSPALSDFVTSLLTSTPAERYAYNLRTIAGILQHRSVENFMRDGLLEIEYGLLTWLAHAKKPQLHDIIEQMLSLHDRQLFVLQFNGIFARLRQEKARGNSTG